MNLIFWCPNFEIGVEVKQLTWIVVFFAESNFAQFLQLIQEKNLEKYVEIFYILTELKFDVIN